MRVKKPITVPVVALGAVDVGAILNTVNTVVNAGVAIGTTVYQGESAKDILNKQLVAASSESKEKTAREDAALKAEVDKALIAQSMSAQAEKGKTSRTVLYVVGGVSLLALIAGIIYVAK